MGDKSLIEKLIEYQREIGVTIDVRSKSFKKDGDRQKTQNYFKTRYAAISALWREFNEIHNQIKELEESATTKYVEEDYYGSIEKVFIELVTRIIDAAEKKFSMELLVTEAEMDGFITSWKRAEGLLNPNEEEYEEEPYEEPEHFNSFSSRNSKQNDYRPPNEPPNPPTVLVAARIKYTHRKNILNALLTRATNNYENETCSVVQLKQQEKMLDNYWENFVSAFEEVIQYVSGDKWATEYAEYEEKYQQVCCLIGEKINKHQQPPRENQHQRPNAIKLKPIEIPTFKGDYESWVSFRDLFTNVYHKNSSLTGAEKLQYLKSSLDGDAARLISHLQLSDGNYISAWQLITGRYENKRLLINRQLELMWNMQNMQNESAYHIKRMHDTVREALHALTNLEVNFVTWDPILLLILIKKLDRDTHRLYEESLKNPKEVQKIEEFLTFLENRFQTLEALSNDKAYRNKTKVNHVQITSEECLICLKVHEPFTCPELKKADLHKRFEMTKERKVCRKCFQKNHFPKKCVTKIVCTVCEQNHNSLLHINKDTNEKNVKVNMCESSPDVLLATAIVRIVNNHQQSITVRALIDPGSQGSFITKSLVDMLYLPKIKTNTEVTGMSDVKAGVAKHRTIVTIKPRFDSEFSLSMNMLILNKLTHLTYELRDNETWPHVSELSLADPKFNCAGEVDLVIGADNYGEILLPDVIKGGKDSPIAQKTELGWILSGKVAHSVSRPSICIAAITQTDDIIKKFWEIEEMSDRPPVSIEDAECEQHFEEKVYRTEDGRYVVSLPFKQPKQSLGSSRKIALMQFFSLEKRLSLPKNVKLKELYVQFMKEYVELGHMEEVQSRNSEAYHIPHHGVLKESSTTTKLRAVFNASQCTSNGKSLNETLLVGPRLQDDLIDIVIRGRKHRIVFGGDIEKMYRQILIHPDDQKYQRIFWRSQSNEEVKEYELKTVTYGTAPAPYLAVKTMQYHALTEKTKYPEACNIILNDFYVDDLFSGCESIDVAIRLQQEIKNVLASGGFPIRKWMSNSHEVLENIPEQDREVSDHEFIDDHALKTLGLLWHPKTDQYGFKVKSTQSDKEYTKRRFLSEISSLFDPLGLVSPVIIKSKILMQQLWQQKINWDDIVPTEIVQQWLNIKTELPMLNEKKVNRWIQYTPDCHIELHGFSDASEQAYSAVVYSRIVDKGGKIHSTIIASKTRVAPLKQVSLPKLELCAVVLLIDLLKIIKQALKIDKIYTHVWTDSEIVLAWINGEPKRWKTFIANRVSKIQQYVEPSNCHHVISAENPADCASRGIFPHELLQHPLWWNGPQWLSNSPDNWPIHISCQTEVEKRAERRVCAATTIIDRITEIIMNHSSLFKLKKTIAYCLRFIHNARNKDKLYGLLTTNDLNTALMVLIKNAQKEFRTELNELEQKKGVSRKSTIANLNPFIDNQGILRVGGRMGHATVAYDSKHQMILAPSHQLTQLIIEDIHQRTLHGGAQLMLGLLRKRFWIVNGRNIIRKIVHNCVTCTRHKARTATQLMGNLPLNRITPNRPFSKCGVDYCGPFDLRVTRGRGNVKTTKAWIAVFVCFAVKAIHLELVSDLTSEAFIAALRRFVARRGACSDLYMDNGTNFVGASTKLKEINQAFKKENVSKISNEMLRHGINWHFNPPGAPHMGGLWEAGVKSVKTHMKKCIGEMLLTFEEMYTLLTQIEACLNSRPITPMTEDSNDFEVLTPGHFLIGEALKHIDEPNLTATKENRLINWQKVQQKTQHFWKRWHRDYLQNLQQRSKWDFVQPNIMNGQMVVIKEENIPPTRWKLGRITKTVPGTDGLIRVVEIQTQTGILKRPISKICQLPIQTELLSENHRVKDKTKYGVKLGSSATFMLILLGLICSITGNNVTNTTGVLIHPFQTDPGIYFNPINHVKIINNEWNIIAYFNLTSYNEELNNLDQHMDELRLICRQTNALRSYCESTMTLLKVRLSRLHENNELISRNHSRSIISQRHKRAIGFIAGLAIGAGVTHYLHSSDTENCKNNIKLLQENEDHLLELIKNHTSIIETTTNILKKEDSRIHDHFLMFKDDLAKLQTSVKYFESWSNQQHANSMIMHQVNLLTNNLMLYISEFEHIQDKVIDVLINAQHGRMHPLIIHPYQIEEQFQFIQLHLPSDSQLPIDDAMELYSKFEVKIGLTNDQILFKIILPLVERQSFELFQLIPVPILKEEKFVWIVNEFEFIVINESMDNYFSLTMKEAQACIQTKKGLLCHPHNPIYNQNTTSSCIMKLLKNNDTSICEVKVTNPYTNIVKLSQGSWLYYTNHSTSAIQSCQTKDQNITLMRNGIIDIKIGCKLQIEGMIIQNYQQFNSTIVSDIPHVSKFTIITNTTQSIIDMNLNSTIDHEFGTDILNITRQLESMKKYQKINHIVTGNHLGIFVLIIMIICIIVIYKQCSNIQINHNKCSI